MVRNTYICKPFKNIVYTSFNPYEPMHIVHYTLHEKKAFALNEDAEIKFG